LWFAGNAIVDELALKTGLGTEIMGYVLSSVQLGFITGTLVFALLMIADRWSPSVVFMICALLAASCNLLLLFEEISKMTLLMARFGTGFFLAGIYPVGMKIAADYYEKGLGKALGFLVGALVFGTALPYLVGSSNLENHASTVVKTVSILAAIGGIVLWLLVPNGPFRKPSIALQLNTGPKLFKITPYRNAAFGYFGHMWELYAFWAFTPLAIKTYNSAHLETISIALWSGVIIALGGVSLTADSPQFSTLVAAAIPNALKGTGLTLVNCIGFAISIVSIQLLAYFSENTNPKFLFLILAIGPALGLLSLRKKSSAIQIG